MDTLTQDVRHSLRLLARSPAFTAVALVTLAIGIGANTAIFSVVNAVLLNPLPYPDADRIVRVREERQAMRGLAGGSIMTADTLENWRDDTESLDAIAGYRPASFTLTGQDEPTRLQGAALSAGMFSLLRATPLVGRVFGRSEEAPGANRVVVLSHSGWEQRFGGDPDIVGRPIVLDDNPHTVVGVMPPGFYFPNREVELWTTAGDHGPEPAAGAGGHHRLSGSRAPEAGRVNRPGGGRTVLRASVGSWALSTSDQSLRTQGCGCRERVSSIPDSSCPRSSTIPVS